MKNQSAWTKRRVSNVQPYYLVGIPDKGAHQVYHMPCLPACPLWILGFQYTFEGSFRLKLSDTVIY